jgi:chorismate synthase
MGGNIIGERFLAMSFGESHGRCVGIVVDGCPAGMPLNESDIQGQLDLRKPGQSVVTTQRKEEDKVEILSGVFNGFTTGAPICMLTRILSHCPTRS